MIVVVPKCFLILFLFCFYSHFYFFSLAFIFSLYFLFLFFLFIFSLFSLSMVSSASTSWSFRCYRGSSSRRRSSIRSTCCIPIRCRRRSFTSIIVIRIGSRGSHSFVSITTRTSTSGTSGGTCRGS